MNAIDSENIARMQQLISQGADIDQHRMYEAQDALDYGVWSPLTLAFEALAASLKRSGNETPKCATALRALLDAKADVERSDHNILSVAQCAIEKVSFSLFTLALSFCLDSAACRLSC